MAFDNECDHWLVCKFGGSSVATIDNWVNIREIVEERLMETSRLMLVCSALSGVTNQLEKIQQLAKSGLPYGHALAEIIEKHRLLARDMDVDADVLLHDHFIQLERTLGLLAQNGYDPALYAEVMACGELMSTRLGAAFLEKCGLSAHWHDARTSLKSIENVDAHNRERSYVSASVDAQPDAALQDRLGQTPGVVITQGFIASNSRGETVLLGRGGSDTSASCFASKLEAARLEIWTDVPGLFSANPRQISQARLIRRMSYHEAEALALGGGKVLHPRCLAPVRNQGIPLYIKSTKRPELDGTVVCNHAGQPQPGFRAVSSRKGLFWFDARTSASNAVNLLPQFSESFSKRDLHISALVSAGRGVQIALDPVLSPLRERDLNEIMNELSVHGDVNVNTDAASVTVVGRDIDQAYHQLGPILMNFGRDHIRHVGQNSHTDVTLMLDHQNPDMLVDAIHSQILADMPGDDRLGPTWDQIQAVDSVGAAAF